MVFDKQAYMKEYSRNYRKAYMPAYRAAHVDQFKKYDMDRYNRVRHEALLVLGGVCVLCGEQEIEFLTIDHVNNDGAEEKKSIHHKQIFANIAARRVDLSRYRLLCRNCNSGLFVVLEHQLSGTSQKDKIRLFSLLGGKCLCTDCSICETEKLSIDHVHNDGNLKRNDGTGQQLYRKILKGTLPIEDFSLLCWNCNYSKHMGKGLCVHERRRKSVV